MINKKDFRIKKNGEPYVYSFCAKPELIENYDEAVNDKNEVWACHHRMEEVFSRKELIRAGWYYNRRPEELIFIKRSEHDGNPRIHIEKRRALEKPKHTKPHTKETRELISKKCKGHKLSEETKEKMSLSRMGHPVSDETRKKLKESNKNTHKGQHWKVVDGKRVWY